jgi:hypothetical protein
MTSRLDSRVEKLERCQPDPTEKMSQAELEAEIARVYDRLFEFTGVHWDKLSPTERQMLNDAIEKGEDTVTLVLDQLRAKQAAEASGAS